MSENFPKLEGILERTKDALLGFMDIITPVIENAKDDHERLYWHHIYEEEEHRLDRINVLLPKVKDVQTKELDPSQGEFIRLLQDVSLEKFGLHNFLEHLDLSLFQFKNTEHGEPIQKMRDMTAEDYQEIKGIMQDLNDKYDLTSLAASTPTDEKEGKADHLKIDMYTQSESQATSHSNELGYKKKFTVGSLK
ncbi:IMEF encapsulin system ferritin-like cargo protein [Alkalihalobacterium bogoriense]|uniref:IMEF encapsulin system ferritin-like cargo protein n=1 Tax=Alkalihalobacterium bogoriense TaxID=246272 RepID=UPI000559218A|nr:IMEF encapsulin system ferritin-like cargo protein [Alkalihalobacterium bogoriense]